MNQDHNERSLAPFRTFDFYNIDTKEFTQSHVSLASCGEQLSFRILLILIKDGISEMCKMRLVGKFPYTVV